jgi:predicted membrane metal-binding protein
MAVPLLAVGFAPTLVVATLALQRCAQLPSSAALAGVALAAGLAAALAWRASRREASGADPWLLVALACAAFAAAGARATDRIADRLSPGLEGVALRATGVVDAMPVRSADGLRFTFRVERCERGPAPGDRAEAVAHALRVLAGEDEPAPAEGADPGRGPSDPTAVDADGAFRLDVRTGPRHDCSLPSRLQLSWHAPRVRPGREIARDRPPEVVPGERWALDVRLKRPHATVNFGAFDRELRWLEEGIGGVGTVRGGLRLEPDAGGARDAVERARSRIRDAMLAATAREGPRERGLLVALAIGDQAAIDPASWTLFNRTSVAHLVSISGMHVTMLAGIAGAAAALAWRRAVVRAVPRAGVLPSRVVGLAVAGAGAVGYALLAGWGVPAQRTCLMLCTTAALLAGVAHRR